MDRLINALVTTVMVSLSLSLSFSDENNTAQYEVNARGGPYRRLLPVLVFICAPMFVRVANKNDSLGDLPPR